MGHQNRSTGQPPGKIPPASSSEPEAPAQQAALEALEVGELEQVKARLFSALAHELRTPLSSLRLAAGLLVSAPPPGATEDHRQLFQLILQSSDRLDLLINSLLDYARLEANHLQLEMQTVDLRLILEAVANLLEPQCRARRQTLDMQLPAEPVNVPGDSFRLRNAVQAVLDMACKRCPADGKLTLGCRVDEDNAFGWICDTGPAVPEAARAHLFTTAAWHTPTNSPQLAAFGLGLPLAHGLITLHGGRLWLAEPDAQEEGMCFYFSLPLVRSGARTSARSLPGSSKD